MKNREVFALHFQFQFTEEEKKTIYEFFYIFLVIDSFLR